MRQVCLSSLSHFSSHVRDPNRDRLVLRPLLGFRLPDKIDGGRCFAPCSAKHHGIGTLHRPGWPVSSVVDRDHREDVLDGTGGWLL